jgi:hypothetical protein
VRIVALKETVPALVGRMDGADKGDEKAVGIPGPDVRLRLGDQVERAATSAMNGSWTSTPGESLMIESGSRRTVTPK